MTINYEEWKEKEIEAYYELRDRANYKFMRKEALSPLDMVPELEIEKGQPYTIWDPPGSPEILREHPENDLRNLEAIYASREGKIIIPIDRRYTRSDLRIAMG